MILVRQRGVGLCKDRLKDNLYYNKNCMYPFHKQLMVIDFL